MKTWLILLLLICGKGFSQNNEFTFNEYLGFVKKYHPLVKNAQLKIDQAQANLMAARGGFDPKIEVDFDKKQYKDQTYYSILNSSFKIPTWYGIEIKAGFDNSEGVYLNPENTLPNKGLTSLGISVPIGQGLLINERMANLSKAKIQVNLSKAEQKLEAIAVLHDAAVAYFEWKKAHDEVSFYTQYAANAEKRFKGIQRLIAQGDKPAIDSIEARIILNNRFLGLEDAQLKRTKAKLQLETFLWLDNNIPVALADGLFPEIKLSETLQETLKTNPLTVPELSVANHPKISALQDKINLLNIDRQSKANQLLPVINLNYTYLSEPSYIDNYRFEDYKIGVQFSFPIFLRKERGSLKLARLKAQEATLGLAVETLQLNNKIKAQQTEITSLSKQVDWLEKLVQDTNTMLSSEERLFEMGESSLFLINARENNVVSTQLSKISIENRYFAANASLFKIMANPDALD